MKQKNNTSLIHVITTIERGGAENALISLVGQQVKTYGKVTIIPLKGEPHHEELLKTLGVDIDFSLANLPFYSQILKFRLIDTKVDLIHAHLPRAEMLVYLTHKRPFVISRHNAEQFFPGVPKFLSRFFSRIITNASVGVIAISNAVKDFLILNRDIAKRTRCSVVYYGYNKINTSNTLKLAPVGNRKISFVTVSRLTPQKNLSLMLAFMQRLKTLQYEASLTIVGVGPLLKVLIREVDDLGLSDVHFVGRKKFVVPFLSQFDFFLLTSDYEGFGLALLEAMDSGLAILAPRTSSIPEVLGNDHPGLFSVGNVDSMIEAFLGRISKIDFQKQALELQKKQLDFFSMNRYTEGVDKFYQESMSRR